MGRSVDYLSNATNVVYFQWPTMEIYNEETDQFEASCELEDADLVFEDIKNYVIDIFPEFEEVNKFDGRETAIILEGYGTQIGLSEYCGLATLSIRVDEHELPYSWSDEYNDEYDKVTEWISQNWAKISAPYNELNKIGTFSNGEAIFEKSIK